MVFLELYEAVYGRPRDDWSKAQWRDVAEQLAEGVCPAPKKKGRPPLSVMAKDNIPALAFWADQERENAKNSGKAIGEKEAIRRVMLESAIRAGYSDWRAKSCVNQKLESAVKQVRTFRAKFKKRN